ncbi:unnamed protein product [Caenorhabditis auriculariae]|uniref:Gustatory receptor n=1 Tax=Caenorhabditis auriculariae TaxID=2777116 RepID=A0A8S1GV90_9PELO|nr:unnamed protein product [Caenorhabditis auriculariae]
MSHSPLPAERRQLDIISTLLPQENNAQITDDEMVEAGVHEVFNKPTERIPPSTPTFLGPFAIICRFSGLDGSRFKKGQMFTFRAILSLIAVVVVVTGIVVKMGSQMFSDAKPLSLRWAETNLLGFMALQSLFGAICIIAWTNSGFFDKFEEQLCRVRVLRIANDETLDDYKKYHQISAIFALPIFIVAIGAAFFNIFSGGGQSPLVALDPIVSFFAALATSLALITYISVNVALNREIEYFNKEIANASRFQQLTLPKVLNTYSKRQSDLIQLVRFANENLLRYCTIIPMFTFTAVVNGVYLVGGFRSEISVLNMIIVIGWVIVAGGVTSGCLVAPANVQKNLSQTIDILLHDDVLHSCGDEQMRHTYRVMMDRCLHSNAKLSVLNAFHIDHNSAHTALFVIPNIAMLLVIIKKLGAV